MGRHSSGKPNNKPSRGLVFLALVFLLIIALIIWLIARDSDSNDSEDVAADQCSTETFEILAVTTDPGSASEQLEEFNDETLAFGDYCDIKVEITDDISEASLLISSYSAEQIVQVLTTGQRTAIGASTAWPTLTYAPVGVANASDASVLEDPSAISYPVATDAMASALVASYATERDENATAALLNEDASLTLAAIPAGQSYAATQNAAAANSSAPEPDVYAIPGLYKQVRAIPLNSAGEVSEDASQAATTFAQFFSNRGVSAPEDSISDQYLPVASAAMPLDLSMFGGDELVTQEATDEAEAEPTTEEVAEPEAPAENQAAPLGTNTLFLIDTSRNMTGGWMAVTRESVANGAASVVGAGGEVALWNYSSPLTGARSVGWRANEDFSNNTNSLDYRLSVLGTGGSPQTHEAINAAAGDAAAHNARIVLITSGSVDQSALDLQGVRLDVIHVGDGSAVDQAVQDAAATHRTVLDPSELNAALQQVLGA